MDDVQYMLRQSTEDSFLFIIDSTMRDRASYPTPSEYYIPFPIPFRNVFALDLVDAQIPRTEYSVESQSNSLAYAPGDYETYEEARASGDLVTVHIEPGDYNVAQLIQVVNTSLQKAALDNGHHPLIVSPKSNPLELTNKLVFTRAEPFSLFMGNSTIRNIVGFGNPSHTFGATTSWDAARKYATDTLVANDVFAAVPATLSSDLVFAGPVPVNVAGYTFSLRTKKVRQRFVASASGLLGSVVVRKVGTAEIQGALYDLSLNALVDSFVISGDGTWVSESESIVLDIAGVTASGTRVTFSTSSPHGLSVGNIIVISNATTLGLNGTFVLTHVTATTLAFASTLPAAVLGNANVYASKEILQGTEYALELSIADDEVYKAETFTDSPTSIEVDNNGVWTTADSVNALSLDVGVVATGYRVEAPGQCNLTGERYVLVRSPDIEQHIHRDFAAAFDRMAPGLGMMKLGGGMGGFRDERFNFLAYSTRKFHPIGKLNGLHIRLETRAGRLYDSHGIDHTLLLCVKMYAPAPSQAIPRDLYPGYTPDARLAFIKKLERERSLK
jgi:hypothetical protein